MLETFLPVKCELLDPKLILNQCSNQNKVNLPVKNELGVISRPLCGVNQAAEDPQAKDNF